MSYDDRSDAFEPYSRQQADEDRREIAKVGLVVEQILNTLDVYFDEGLMGWSYVVDTPAAEVQGSVAGATRTAASAVRYSKSTNAMILLSIAVASGRVPENPLAPSDYELPQAVSERRPFFPEAALQQATQKIISEIVKTGIQSRTFGENDPFTLTWLAGLLHVLVGEDGGTHSPSYEEFDKFREIVLKQSRKRIEKASLGTGQGILEWRIRRHEERPQEIEHAFPTLRSFQLYRLLNLAGYVFSIRTQAVEAFFLGRVHRHLSLSTLPGADFDAGELAFSTEGCLLLRRDALGSAVLARVFQVLTERQALNSYWGPMRPFVGFPQGAVQMPLSVEIGNSLLRICGLAQNPASQEHYFSDHLPVFRAYARWLLSRRVEWFAEERRSTKDANGQIIRCVGWASEHVQPTNSIHLWETSQVLLFLTHYASMLQQHLARGLLSRVGLGARQTVLGASSVARHRPRVANSPTTTNMYQQRAWDEATAKFEPLQSDRYASNTPYRVYRHVARHYVKPRQDDATNAASGDVHYSILLYGPPGTGKSTFAKELGRVLGYRLIQISPSDFVARGEAEVEARARAVFEALNEQKDSVILLDEIDRLILDRESLAYSKQSDIFQFMTPGMLTKINELRERKRSIFIIGTNFEDHIDKAIKRRGRIDDRLLLLPPDRTQRLNIILGQLKRRKIDLSSYPDEEVRSTLRGVLDGTALFGFGELQELVSTCTGPEASGQSSEQFSNLASNLAVAVKQIEPPVTLVSYAGRFKSSSGVNKDEFLFAQEPLEEYFTLVDLATEEDAPLAPEDAKAFLDIVDHAYDSSERPGQLEVVGQRVAKREILEEKHLRTVRDAKVQGRLADLYLRLADREL